MHYIHLVITEQRCSGECLHRRLCHNHLMHVHFALGLQSTHLLRCLLLPVWEDCLLSVAMSKLLYICIHLLLNYTQNVGSSYTCPNTERPFLGKLLHTTQFPSTAPSYVHYPHSSPAQFLPQCWATAPHTYPPYTQLPHTSGPQPPHSLPLDLPPAPPGCDVHGPILNVPPHVQLGWRLQ